MNIAILGGAGYIGSHAVKFLIERGHDVTCVDNLHNGHRLAVHPKAHFFVTDISHTFQLAEIFQRKKIEAVMHFAASSYVGESVVDPRKYYRNNVAGTISVLDAMAAAGVKKLVFSSTCATYGVPEVVPIVEELVQRPINAYGASKLMIERMLVDVARAEAIAFAAPRYFNVAGSALDGTIGEDHRPETHLIPILLQAAAGRRDHVKLYGTDYKTKDGTCIRDYIHVWDLVEAHLVLLNALDKLRPGKKGGGGGMFYNLGVGRGYSNREIIEAVKRVTGKNIVVKETKRRPGDPPELWACPDKIKQELGWSAKITNLDEIVRSAWRWFQARPNGYG